MKSFWKFTIVALTITACSKSASGPSAVRFRLQASNTATGLAAKQDAGTITWNSGTATPGSVKFEAKKGTSEVEFTTSGQTVNLFQLSDVFGNITLPEGSYSEIELKMSLDGSLNSPALELNGTYNGIPVKFSLTTPLLLKAEKNNVTVTGGSFTAVTDLNLSLYTTGITQGMMNSATQTNGVILISSASNSSLYNIIIQNMDRFHHAEFGHD
ncbi:MAG TPA: hypothetical protein VF145_01525 [Chitinophagaceae bacterium]